MPRKTAFDSKVIQWQLGSKSISRCSKCLSLRHGRLISRHKRQISRTANRDSKLRISRHLHSRSRGLLTQGKRCSRSLCIISSLYISPNSQAMVWSGRGNSRIISTPLATFRPSALIRL